MDLVSIINEARGRERYDSQEALVTQLVTLAQNNFNLETEAAVSEQLEVLEGIIGRSGFLNSYWVEGARKVSSSVCRISLFNDGQEPEPIGSGFLVAPMVVMTCNHVIPDRSYLIKYKFEFGYDYRDDGAPKTYKEATVFSGDRNWFYTDTDLDFSLIGLRPLKNVLAGEIFCANKLSPKGYDLKPQDRLNIIHHPDGAVKQISFRGNYVKGVESESVNYTTGTLPGSSGSPVATDRWKIVAVHNSFHRKAQYNSGSLIKVILESLMMVRSSQTRSEEVAKMLDEVLENAEI